MSIMPPEFQSHNRPDSGGCVAQNEEMFHAFIGFLAKDAPIGI